MRLFPAVRWEKIYRNWAPEHVSDQVLRYMGKPRHAVYEKFCRKYAALNEKLGKKQYLVPYLMSSHPGCGLREAVELAEYVRDLGYMPEQVQDFYPTPSTLSTVMYYTGLDPRTMEPVYVPTDPHEKEMQRALIQYRDPKNYALIHEALVKAGRTDLIGYGPKCLIRPRRGEAEKAPHPAQKQPAQKRPAQNTTREQMKMFLTRLGFGSKIVITGDITQIDLPSDKVSGLKDAVRILDNVPDIAICRLTASDVVRHALVQRIIAAYETAEHSAKNGLPGQKKVYRRKL